MSDFMSDLSSIMNDTAAAAVTAKHSTNTRAGSELETMDFLQLMVASFQNQSIDDVASTSDMMNQMMQMSVIQAVSSLTNLITESTSLSYAASLVGKEVTVADYSGAELKNVVGTVTGTGTLNGQQIIFLGERSYYLTDIMAVGRLPGDEGPADAAKAELLDAVSDAEEDAYADPDGLGEIIWPGRGDNASAGQVGASIEEKEEEEEALEAVAARTAQAEAAAEAEDEAQARELQAAMADGWEIVSGVNGQALPTAEQMEAAAEQMYETSL